MNILHGPSPISKSRDPKFCARNLSQLRVHTLSYVVIFVRCILLKYTYLCTCVVCRHCSRKGHDVGEADGFERIVSLERFQTFWYSGLIVSGGLCGEYRAGIRWDNIRMIGKIWQHMLSYET